MSAESPDATNTREKRAYIEFDEDLAARLLGELSLGRSLKRICETEDWAPHRATVFRWIGANDNFRQQYDMAKAEAADAYADDIEDLAEDVLSGKYEPQAARVAGDLKKWTAAKLKPKKYGDKVDVTSGGDKIGYELSASQAEQLIRARADRSDPA